MWRVFFELFRYRLGGCDGNGICYFERARVISKNYISAHYDSYVIEVGLWEEIQFKCFEILGLLDFWPIRRIRILLGFFISYLVSKVYLTEHSFTEWSALYWSPFELLKNRKLHNQILFFRVCFGLSQDSSNSKNVFIVNFD